MIFLACRLLGLPSWVAKADRSDSWCYHHVVSRTDTVIQRIGFCMPICCIFLSYFLVAIAFFTESFLCAALSIFGISIVSMPSLTSAFASSTSISAGRRMDRENEPNESSS